MSYPKVDKEKIQRVNIGLPKNLHKYYKDKAEALGVPYNSLILIDIINHLELAKVIKEGTVELYV